MFVSLLPACTDPQQLILVALVCTKPCLLVSLKDWSWDLWGFFVTPHYGAVQGKDLFRLSETPCSFAWFFVLEKILRLCFGTSINSFQLVLEFC